MSLRVLDLDPADTFYSVRDRLLQGQRGRTVLLLPEKAAPLSGLDLVLLRRLADRERLDIGLVTGDSALARQARALGLPAFASVGLAEHFRPGWWRAGRRSEHVGFAPGQDRRPPGRALQGQPEGSIASRRARHLIGLLLALFILALLAGALLYVLPKATVTLEIAAQPGQVILDLTADPTVTASAGSAIPARELRRELQWEAFVAATGDDAADQQRLRALALQGLRAETPAYWRARLSPGEILVDNSVHVDVINELFTASGEAAVLTLTVASQALVIHEADIAPIALRELAGALPESFAPDPATLRLDVASGPADTPNGLRVTAQAVGRAALDEAAVAEALRGQPLVEAGRVLSGLPADSSTIAIWPGWWRDRTERMPLRAGNIRVNLLP